MTIVLKARTFLDGTGATPLSNGALIIEDDRITHYGPSESIATPPNAQVIDFGDRTVMPGLIDAHVHLLFTGSARSGHDLLSASPQQLLLTGVRNSQRALKSGLTTVRDCGDVDYLSLSLRDAIDDNILLGPRIICSGPPITTTGGQGWQFSIECDSDNELRTAVRTLVKGGTDFIKLMGTGGHATPGSNPESSQFPAEAYHTVAQDAHRMGKKVAVHVHGIEGIRNAVSAGIDTLEHCSWRGNGTIQYDQEVVKSIVDQGLFVSLAMPATWYRLKASEMVDVRQHPEKLWEARYPTISAMYESGVKLVTSSDTGSTGTEIDQMHLLMTFLSTKMGLSVTSIIHSATGLAAEALGLDHKIGTLNPGRIADLMIVNGNPLTDISTLGDVYQVYKSGRLVVKDGSLVI